MPRCDDALHCMRSKRTMGEWDLCMEINVHSNLHPWMGGAWDCHFNDDWANLTRRNASIWPEEVLDFIGPNLPVLWTKLAVSSDRVHAHRHNHTGNSSRAGRVHHRHELDLNATSATYTSCAGARIHLVARLPAHPRHPRQRLARDRPRRQAVAAL